MKYGITKLVFGFTGFIDISKQEYENIKLARERLFEALYMEEKFDLVVENFIEYETELLALSVRYMINRDQNYDWFHAQRNLIDRRMLNLLSACRGYLDQIIHHLNNIYGKSSIQVDKVNREKSKQYDMHLGYRVMEALRNYVQHRGSPIHNITYPASRIESKSKSKIMYSVNPHISPSYLENDKKFKKNVLKEMKSMGDKIDIKPLIREYIECIGNIHEVVRKTIDSDIPAWEKTSIGVIEDFKSRFGSEVSIIGLCIVAQTEEEVIAESFPIFTDYIERRRGFEQKNRTLDSLTARFTTNEILDNNA